MCRQDLQTIPLDLLIERAPNVGVACKCNSCGRIVELPSRQLLDHLTIKKIDRRIAVLEIGQHLICSHCRSRDVSTKVTLPPFLVIDEFGPADESL